MEWNIHERRGVIILDFLSFLQRAVSPFHAVQAGAELLHEAGFVELDPREAWHLQPGKKYLVRVFDSTLVAFRIGEDPRAHLHIATAHTDFPCLRVKPSAVIAAKGYGTLNVEVYGGMIRSSWLDRPLSLAGKVVLAGVDPYTPEVHLVDIGRPLLTIPHLAIHMNRKVNEGETLNPQKDMLPLFTMLGMSGSDDSKSAHDAFLDFLADECHLERGRILSYELTAYPTDAPCRFGAKNEFLSASRLDNMTSVYACLEGLLHGESQNGIQCIALFDNEEVGSCTKQGADSFALPNILMRLYSSLGYGQDAYFADLARGFLLSLDVAHALHPNAPEKADPTNAPRLGGGVTIKAACSQAYAGDAEAIAVTKALCEAHAIPYQMFLNRSDIRGGSTLGSMLTANMPMRAMDVGAAILAMHSARETMGADDQQALERLVTVFFSR